MRRTVFVVLCLGAVVAKGFSINNEGSLSPTSQTEDRPLLTEESHKTSPAITSNTNILRTTENVLEVDPAGLPLLVRTKRNFYGRGDPWGRDRIYGRRRHNSRIRKAKFNRGRRIRYFFDRKKNRNDRPPPEHDNDAGRSFKPYKKTGLSETYQPSPSPSSSSSSPSSPRRPSGGFVSARSSGVARVEQTMG